MADASLGLRRRERNIGTTLDGQIDMLVELAEAVRGQPPGMVGARVRALVDRAIFVAAEASALCECIRTQHPADGTGP